MIFFHRGLHPIDWLIVLGYAVGMLGIGYVYSKRAFNAEDYFLGGGRMPAWIMGISLFATLFSTISYLSMPGEMIRYGPTYLFIFAAIPFSYVVVGYVLIPAFMRQRVISAYELLEANLGREVRTLGAMLFIALRIVWMTVLLYMASAAITVIAGLKADQVDHVIVITGAVAVTYTTLGGMRAVAVSDVAQSLILLTGAIATLVVIRWRLGDFSWIPTEPEAHWEQQPLFSLDPHVRTSVVGVIIMNFIWQLATAGGDQTAIQRYMSTRNIQSARHVYLIHSIMAAGISVVVCLIGFALFRYYQRFASLLPTGEDARSRSDDLFPLFIANELPVGVSGLMFSALFAAAMSSLDSGINSITAVVHRDFARKSVGVGRRNGDALGSTRRLGVLIGIIVMLLATQVGNIPGTFLEVTKKTTNLFAAPIFGLFILALFVKRVSGVGAMIGTMYGCVTAVTIAFWDIFTGLRPISFMWIMPPSLAIQLLVAIAVGNASVVSGYRRHVLVAGWLLPVVCALIALLLVRRNVMGG